MSRLYNRYQLRKPDTETLLLAGKAEFNLDELCNLIPEDLHPEIQDKVAGLRHLILKGTKQFIAQIQACGEAEDQDTIEDLRRIAKDPPPEFADALAKDELRFLIVTYNPAERHVLQEAIDAFVRAGVVQFDCSDTIQILTA